MWGKNPEPKPTNTPAAKTPEPIASVPPKPPDAAAVTTPAPVAVTPAPAASPAYPSPAPQLSANASRIGPGLKVHGVISGESDLIVEGETNGKIYLSNARVTVAKTGRVQADIEGLEISIEGSVQGNLKATDRIRLGASSNVQGSSDTPRVSPSKTARVCAAKSKCRAQAIPSPSKSLRRKWLNRRQSNRNRSTPRTHRRFQLRRLLPPTPAIFAPRLLAPKATNSWPWIGWGRLRRR